MTTEEIKYLSRGKVIGNKRLQRYVYKTLSIFPDEISQNIAITTWFMGSFDDAYAYAFSGNDLKDQHLIFLSDDLLNQSDEQIQFTIAHEIGHIFSGHKNSVQYKQSKDEIRKQEKEADEFANQYGFLV